MAWSIQRFKQLKRKMDTLAQESERFDYLYVDEVYPYDVKDLVKEISKPVYSDQIITTKQLSLGYNAERTVTIREYTRGLVSSRVLREFSAEELEQMFRTQKAVNVGRSEL